jgi:hypothetical protein
LCNGISQAGFLEQEAPRLENWLNNNQNGQMSYMENNFDKRLNQLYWLMVLKCHFFVVELLS